MAAASALMSLTSARTLGVSRIRRPGEVVDPTQIGARGRDANGCWPLSARITLTDSRRNAEAAPPGGFRRDAPRPWPRPDAHDARVPHRPRGDPAAAEEGDRPQDRRVRAALPL